MFSLDTGDFVGLPKFLGLNEPCVHNWMLMAYELCAPTTMHTPTRHILLLTSTMDIPLLS